jgi:hypothetical protein
MRAVKIIYLFIILFFIFGGIWMCTHKISDEQMMRQRALKYLEDTYQEHFLIEEYAEKSLLVPNHQFKVRSLKYQRSFNLLLQQENQFADNYFSLQLESEANRYFKNMIKSQNSDIQTRVIIYNDRRPKKLSKNAGFKDFIDTGDALIFLYIFSERQLLTDEKVAILDMIEAQNIVQLGSFVEVIDLNSIKKIANPVEIMAKHTLIKSKIDFKQDNQQKLILETNDNDEVS